MANGLLDLLGGLGTTPPAYMEGLLGQPATEDLRKRSIGTGLANALVGYLAMPKNQNLGLGRILAGAAQSGMQGAQGVYDTATQDYLQAQKIAEIQRQKEQQSAQQEAINQVAQTNPQLGQLLKAYPSAAAGVLEKIYTPKEVKATGKPLSSDDIAALKEKGINLDTSAGQQYQFKPDGTIDLINTTPSGATGTTELDKLVAARDKLIAKNPNDPTIKLYNAAITKQTQFAPPVTVNLTNTSETEYSKKLGGGLAEQNLAVINTARGAPEQIDIARRVKETLTKNPITGTGATTLLGINNALSTAGIIDPSSGVNTQSLVSDLSKVTLQNIKSSGLGAGQGFTDKDLRFLNDAVSGSIDWNAENIRRVAELNEKAGLKSIEKHNQLMGTLSPEEKRRFGVDVIQVPSTGTETSQQRIQRILNERKKGSGS